MPPRAWQSVSGRVTDRPPAWAGGYDVFVFRRTIRARGGCGKPITHPQPKFVRSRHHWHAAARFRAHESCETTHSACAAFVEGSGYAPTDPSQRGQRKSCASPASLPCAVAPERSGSGSGSGRFSIRGCLHSSNSFRCSCIWLVITLLSAEQSLIVAKKSAPMSISSRNL